MSITSLTLEQKRHLVGFLELICQELELTNSQFQDAKQKYEAVAEWLNSGEVIRLLGPQIIPQGSIRLGTTVRPIGRDEFDIDLVCKLIYAGKEQDQANIRNIIGARLKENKKYSSILEPLNRGWRLNYSKSQKFHLDITPAVMNGNLNNGEILVPDKELKKWKPSNPEGYAERFELYSSLLPRFVVMESLRFTAGISPLPEPQPFKSILKRTIQILKRHRDEYFQNKNSKLAPISIIITTLAAKSYALIIESTTFESELDLMYQVIKNMDKFIIKTNVNGKTNYSIPNETTIGENFAEKWNKHPERAEAFYIWQGAALEFIERLSEQEGLDNLKELLAGKFGAYATNRAFDRYTNSVSEARSKGQLKTSSLTGIGILDGITMKNNTFFGI